jgi:hypothetical protein
MDPVSRAQSENTQDSRLARFGDKLQKPWPKGVAQNPGGRPKKPRITRIYQRILANQDNRLGIEQAIINTLTGDSRMAAVLMLREMAERTEGRVTQSIEVTNTAISDADLDARLAKFLGIHNTQLTNEQPEPSRPAVTTE